MMTWKHKWTHYIGVGSSLLCLLHCLALPVILVAFPAFTTIDLSVIDTFWEYVFIGLSIVSVYTIVQMHRTHKKYSLALPLAFLGVALLATTLVLHDSNFGFLLPVGSIMILVAHILNLKMCNTHKNCLKECAHSNTTNVPN
jgi:hypothetical protein